MFMTERFLFLFVLSLGLSGLLTRGLIRYSGQWRLVARPRGRDVHEQPTPRLGGVAMFLAVLAVSFIGFRFIFPEFHFASTQLLGFDRTLLLLFISLTIIALGMLLDDLRGLPVFAKVVIQVGAAALLLLAPLRIEYLNNPFGDIIYLTGPAPWGLIVPSIAALLWLVVMMNAVNLMDGLDGLAGGLTLVALLTLLLLSLLPRINQPETALLSLIGAGAVLGFLVYNWHPAKLFMGDSGSHFLGLYIGALAIIAGGKVATTALVLGVPILDLGLVAIRRMVAGKNPLTSPGRDHLHHRLLDAGFSVPQASLILILIAAFFGAVALRSDSLGKFRAAGLLFMIVLIVWLLTRKKHESRIEQ